ncbi:hypothetical protein F7725_005959 [Dissostichus mawsoni]|uniref:Uncharacterized protein n=1 Tax=Dissostichus mawsoni TaxID=36200 RepID=A0A7J5YSQ5_DISMA|nr:hypothetical protein F7725_005959 [Dissostichus mawsoni]
MKRVALILYYLSDGGSYGRLLTPSVFRARLCPSLLGRHAERSPSTWARFAALRRPMDINLDDLPHVIYSCFVLHNFVRPVRRLWMISLCWEQYKVKRTYSLPHSAIDISLTVMRGRERE